MKYAVHLGIQRANVALQTIHCAYPREILNFAARRDIQNYAENIVVGPTAFAATKKIAAKMKPSVVGSSAAKRIAFAVMEKTAARPKKHAVVNSVARPVCFVATVKDVA